LNISLLLEQVGVAEVMVVVAVPVVIEQPLVTQ
jgi:hypothetical protein